MQYIENEVVELKQKLNDHFEKKVVAFLNTHNGIIYIGINDNGKICGVDKLDEVIKKIADIITFNIQPNALDLIKVNTLYEDGKHIIEVKVNKGSELYYINKYGRSSKGCYIRIGTTCRSMSEEQIQNKYNLAYLSKRDISQIESYRTTFSFKQLKIYYGEKKLHINDETFENNLSLKTKDGKYNLLAELLSDENRISIKIARFQGKDKSVLLEKSEYGYQCILVAIDRMINRLEAENYTMSIIQGKRRLDRRLLNMDSVREVFINAIAHNDWTKVEPAVYIFEDRIEIISYGGLPYNQTEEMFFKGISSPRNKSLMRILSDLDYVEQTGHGIPDVVKMYGKEVFEITENYINVILPFNKQVLKSHKKLENISQKNKTDKNKFDVEDDKLDIEGNKLDIEGNKLDIEGNKLDIGGNKLDIEGDKLDIGGNKLDIEGNKLDIRDDKLDIGGNKLDIDGNKLDIEDDKLDISELVKRINIRNDIKDKLILIYNNFKKEIFSSSSIVELLYCSRSSADNYIKVLFTNSLIIRVEGYGKGKYKFK